VNKISIKELCNSDVLEAVYYVCFVDTTMTSYTKMIYLHSFDNFNSC